MLKDEGYFKDMLKEDMNVLSEQVERLVVENRLLRAASEEQRELNGKLRTEIKYRLLMKAALEEWADCFNEQDIRLHDIRIENVYNLTSDLLNKMED